MEQRKARVALVAPAVWGEPEPPENAPRVPTLAELKERFVTEHLVAERRKPSSIDAVESIYREHLAPDLGAKSFNEITDSDVQALKSKLASKSPKTVNNVVATLGSMFRRAIEWKVVERMPRSKLLPEVRPFATDVRPDADRFGVPGVPSHHHGGRSGTPRYQTGSRGSRARGFTVAAAGSVCGPS